MTRLNTTLSDADSKNLDDIVESTSLKPNDAIRKALATEAFVQKTIEAGGKLLVELPDGSIKQIEFVG